MARKERNDVDYFPHPVTHGRKMFYLRNKYKNDGYTVWFMLLEQLGKADYHYLDLSEEVQMMYLSSEFMVSEELLKDIINDLVKLGEFDRELWEGNSIIFDKKFVDNISDAYKKRSNDCITRGLLWERLSVKGNRNKPLRSNNKPLEGSEVPVKPQRIVKDRKVKKTKEEYLTELAEFRSHPDKEWIASLISEYTHVDVIRSLSKIADFWATDEGYQRKMKTRSKKIDWKATFKNGLNMEFNQIPKSNSDHYEGIRRI